MMQPSVHSVSIKRSLISFVAYFYLFHLYFHLGCSPVSSKVNTILESFKVFFLLLMHTRKEYQIHLGFHFRQAKRLRRADFQC